MDDSQNRKPADAAGVSVFGQAGPAGTGPGRLPGEPAAGRGHVGRAARPRPGASARQLLHRPLDHHAGRRSERLPPCAGRCAAEDPGAPAKSPRRAVHPPGRADPAGPLFIATVGKPVDNLGGPPPSPCHRWLRLELPANGAIGCQPATSKRKRAPERFVGARQAAPGRVAIKKRPRPSSGGRGRESTAGGGGDRWGPRLLRRSNDASLRPDDCTFMTI